MTKTNLLTSLTSKYDKRLGSKADQKNIHTPK